MQISPNPNSPTIEEIIMIFGQKTIISTFFTIKSPVALQTQQGLIHSIS